MAEAVAIARFARHSPRKVGQVLPLIRRKNAEKALTTLEFMPRRAGIFVYQTLKSAVHNLGGKLGKKIEPKEAWIKSCSVGPGPHLKRIRAGSMGRAMPYKHKTCHLTIIVTDVP
ncbi:MAG: 50S ribosomal protein L22 [Elusimicrobia bacterium]|nr:50S ribosomal protein L22 [Elusimicrobiota bacterium]